MKTQASVLAALLGSAAAQTPADKAKDVPRFQAVTQDVQCTISGETAVSDAASALATAKQAVDDWKKVGGDLALAEAKVVTDRTARDAAVAAVLVKDGAFKLLLQAAQAQEETVMALYVTAMAKKKLWTDKVAAEAVALDTKTTTLAAWNLADADKTAATTAVSAAITHKSKETTTKSEALTDWMGTSAVGATASAGSKKNLWDVAVADKAAAVAALATAKTNYDNKVTEANNAKPAQDTGVLATREKDSAATLVTRQTLRNGTSDTAQFTGTQLLPTAGATIDSYQKVKAVAVAAATPGAAGTAYAGLNTAITNFKDSGKAVGDLAKSLKAKDAVSTNEGTYATVGSADQLCDDTAAVAVMEVSGGDITLGACKTACTAKNHPAGLVSTATTNANCYGIQHLGTGTKVCKLFHGAIPAGSTGSETGTNCYKRTSSEENETMWGAGKMGDYVTKTAAFETGLNAAWKAKSDAVLVATRNYDMGVASLAYLTGEYQTKLVTGKKTIWEALNTTYTTAFNAIQGLKDIADPLGMNPSTNFTRTTTAVGNASVTQNMDAYTTAVTNTLAAEQLAKTAYETADTDLTTQIAMDVITTAWKSAAEATFNDINPKVKTVGAVKGSEELYTDAQGETTAASGVYDAALLLYTQEIAKTAYKDAITNAEDGTNPDGKTGADIPAVATTYQAILDERVKVGPLTDTLDTSIAAVVTARAGLATKEATLKAKQGALETALEACEAKQYKAFQDTYNTAVTTRATTLGQIGDTIKTQKTAKAALKDGSGAEGARCERPRSNGDKRDRRSMNVPSCDVDKELCCGAASKTVGLVQLTVETCQKNDKTKYDYQPKRQPLKTGLPAKESWDFACIDSAHRVLVALAAATSVGLMMQ